MLVQNRKDAAVSGAILAAALLFYLFFAVYDGAVICVDSPSYISMDISREPLYPSFLALLRAVFGESGDFYLTVAAFLQSILAAVAAWSLADFLRREFKLPGVMGFLLLAMPLATSLLCRFAARRASMYSNSILTEGIACSLFLIFFRCLLAYCLHPKTDRLVWTCLLSFLLIATRKQMYISLVLLMIGMGYVTWKGKCYQRGLFAICGCSVLIFLGNTLFDCSYNYALRGSFSGHSSDNRFLATMVFYNAERQDGEAIRDPQLRALFEEIYDACEAGGYLKGSAGSGWHARVGHFEEHYDNIQIDTMWRMIREYVYETEEGAPFYLEERVDAMTQEMIDAVLPRVKWRLAGTFLDSILVGLVTTVAQCTPVLTLYAAVIYPVYLGLLLWNLRKNGPDGLSLLGVLTLFSVAGNVAAVSAFIFCQTRYTIYNMPLFYCSLLLLLWNVLPESFRQRLQTVKRLSD